MKSVLNLLSGIFILIGIFCFASALQDIPVTNAVDVLVNWGSSLILVAFGILFLYGAIRSLKKAEGMEIHQRFKTKYYR